MAVVPFKTRDLSQAEKKSKCCYIQATPPNSEIICVQNVGAKVEMVSYLKK